MKEIIIDNPFKVNPEELPKVKNYNAMMKALVILAKENGWQVLFKSPEGSKVYKAR